MDFGPAPQHGGRDIAVRVLAFIVTYIMTTAAFAATPTAVEERAEFAKTCYHYENRSRFDPRGEGQSFPAILADSCEAALETLDRMGEGATEARQYLLRLTELKNVVVDMQVRAFQASRQTERSAGRYARIITSMSETGEYLIAREIGVVETLDAWTAIEIARKSPEGIVVR